MRKYTKLLLVFYLISTFTAHLFPSLTIKSQENANVVTVVYSLNDAENFTQVQILDVLLHQFPKTVQLVQDTALTPELLANSNKLIYFGVDNGQIPEQTVELINQFPGSIFALGHNTTQLTRFQWLNIQEDDVIIDTITFKNNDISLGEGRLIYQVASENSMTDLVATSKQNPQLHAALSVNNGKDTFFATHVLAKPFDFFLTDSLQQFLEIPFQENIRYLRLEDIHPKADVKLLKKQAKFLKKKGIPYMVAVIPVYTNAEGEEIHLVDSPELVKTLKYMQKNGASIVLHGYRHQYRRSETGEGFEFWDVENNRPILQDSLAPAKKREDFASDADFQTYVETGHIFEKQYIDAAITNGVDELVAHGLYPLAFEAPHYTMSQQGYQVLSEHFSSYVGRLQLSDTTWQSEYQPIYQSQPSFLHGMTVYPETLGFLEQNNPNSLTDVKKEVALISNFNQVYFSAFYHPYLGIEGLKEMLEVLDSTNATNWFDLKQLDNVVTTDHIKITTHEGVISVEKSDTISNYEKKVRFKKYFPYGLSGALLLLGIILYFYRKRKLAEL